MTTYSIMQKRPYPSQPLLALVFLFSGAPLIVSIITGMSLAVSLLSSATLAAFVAAYQWSRTDARGRALLKATLITGLMAGAAATAAYDLTRISLVRLGQMKFYPFETFNRFGELLIGFDAPRELIFSVGTAYHLLNGIAFATAFCFLLGGRKWYYGVLWALGLEVLMFTTYTNWLDLSAVMEEFVAVSLTGHIAYGATFGLISQYRLNPDRLAREVPSH